MSEFLDPDFAPFTVEELVRAEMLLGEAEEVSRDMWTRAAEDAQRARDEFEKSTDPNAAYGLTLGEGTLLALALLSEETAERVEEIRTRGWRLHRAMNPAEQERFDRLHEQEERRWREQLAMLRKHIRGDPG
ncbi:MAG: hypothetical protein KY466_06120 [Gemmatimonadetes bacterium]|nr:hypothetical protein [Gemmatimonadota bacterium]